MNRICRPVRFFSIHPEYVDVNLTSSTIAAIMVSIYSPLDIIFDQQEFANGANVTLSLPACLTGSSLVRLD